MRNLHNIASLKSGTVHAAHDNAGRTICRPNAVTEGEWVDDVMVNCGNCKRIIAEAERAAHIMATEEYSGVTDPKHEHLVDALRAATAGLRMAAFDRQRNLDIIHARVIGQCPGCFRDSEGWAHRVSCPMYFRGGAGFVPVTEAWSSEEIRKFWTTGQHATAGR